MDLIARIAAIVRGDNAEAYAENDQDRQVNMNGRGDLQVSIALPERADIVRLGESWQVQSSSAFAALTTEPTTTSALSIYNNDPGGLNARSLIIDSVTFYERVVDFTQQNELTIFCMNNVTPVTSPTLTALTVRSLSGRQYSGKVRTLVAATVVNDGWFAEGNTTPGASAVAGGAWRTTQVMLNGKYVVPPGGIFSVHGAKIAATASQLIAAICWHEVRFSVK